MQEIIGNITLDYTYYSGEDLYSDGDVEDQLLKIAMDSKENLYNGVIVREKSWPVLYHFSHIRQNIVEWLPISKTDRVLEIGSGCGAITGILSEKAGQVRCIELSKKRSYINAYRHRKQDNIRIDVGNFQDIEQNLTETFDYITLIGVFEYSEGYIGGQNPYVDMLKKISAHLKPGGRIVIAIENRLGLKYWAGCREDHVGKYFEGLEGYHYTRGVKTFSRTELEEIIRSAGEFETEFYYPYPDYKFPMAIYSDRRLPAAGELNSNMCNFDRERLQVFDEGKVFDTLLESRLFPQFSNSFLVVLTVPGEKENEKEKTVYSKYSNERAIPLAIRTDILEKADGRQCVRKTAWREEGREHICALSRSFDLLEKQYEGTDIHINRCSVSESGVELEYLEGISLEEQMDELIRGKQYDKARELMLNYLDTVKDTGSQTDFQMTEDFCRVFGNPELPKGLKSLAVTDIDMVLENVLIHNGWNLIDYEWTFAFPIPVSFVLFRIIHYYKETSELRKCVNDWNLYEEMGISGEETAMYLQMEKHFQEYILGSHVPLREMYEEISPGVLNVYRMAEAERKKRDAQRLQVFYASEGEFREEDSVYYPMPEGRISLSISIPEHIGKIRLDPCSYAGVLTVKRLKFAGGSEERVNYISNGFMLDEKRIVFDTMDPQILISEIPEGAAVLEAELEMDIASKEIGMFLQELERLPRQQEEELERLRDELGRKERLIHDMENTKVWKIYRKFRKMTGKGR
ncbi:MAG: SAM-dependent methyltransferase [Ruminococcus sp.]|jgi:SAM-dependent methyltransferase